MPTDDTPPPSDSQVVRNVLGVARDLGHVSVLAAICLSFPALGGFILLGFLPRIKPHVENLGPSAPWTFAAAFGVATGLALLPTYALSVASGYFFGFTNGAALAVAGVAIGSIIGYVWASALARARVSQRIDRDPRARAVRDALVNRGAAATTGVVALLRFPPNSPFAITNLVMGATGVKFVPFFIGTVAGMAPRTILAASIGHAAQDLVEAVKSGGKWKIIGIAVSFAVLLLVFWLFGKWSREALARINRPNDPGAGSGSDLNPAG